MPHDVTMPQLGMAQDAGRIVSWLKAQGDPVRKGDALFEVETDKATMEVEAQTDGFLTAISAAEGDDVPVGAVIARISDSAEDDAPAPAAPETTEATAMSDTSDDLPKGKTITMPQLGMAQDSGLIVGWQKQPGDAIAADDVLFEVETDKSTMEVPAGADGYLAATLAEAGEEVPVGDAVAIISAEKPESPVARSAKARPAAAPAAAAPAGKDTAPAPAKAPSPAPVAAGGRILASPKARRLAMEQGLDLNRLVQAGHPQPFHVRDLETLKALPAAATGGAATAALPARHLTAETAADGFDEFADWAAQTAGLTDPAALLAGLAAASMGGDHVVAVESFGASRSFAARARLGDTEKTDAEPALRLRDLRHSPVNTVQMGPEDTPVLTLKRRGAGLTITLECAADQLPASDALALLSNFAGRMEQPLRHLL
ncbi:biotin/lipoyl-containing protein [Oceanibium sediminis]|uniref:biotin/lipoyl-containing protein n=1 Tax=Oceanibium sediminis TaxID=2026339 RepID=UPI000DD3A2C2|nr:biotin/lipoyl-containing protein [Oceanibium sediminis]